MDFEAFSALDAGLTKEDWERTPASVRRLLRFLLEDFEQRLADLEEDKILSEIEEERLSERQTRKQVRVSKEQEILRCSFCGQSSEEVSKIVVGPTVNICNECIDICNEILAELGVKQ